MPPAVAFDLKTSSRMSSGIGMFAMVLASLWFVWVGQTIKTTVRSSGQVETRDRQPHAEGLRSPPHRQGQGEPSIHRPGKSDLLAAEDRTSPVRARLERGGVPERPFGHTTAHLRDHVEDRGERGEVERLDRRLYHF